MLTFDAELYGDLKRKSASLTFILNRRQSNQYRLLFGRAYGMAVTREWAILNSTTPDTDPLVLSAENRPCIWVDSDMERCPRPFGGRTISSLVTCDPPVFKVTGRTKQMYAEEGGWREAHEVEILLKEEEIAHSCYCCGKTEYPKEDVFENCGGENYTSIYWCLSVSSTVYILFPVYVI